MRRGTPDWDDDTLGAEPSEGSGPKVEALAELPPLANEGFYYVLMVDGHISKVRHCGSQQTYDRLKQAMAEGARVFKAQGRYRWSKRKKRRTRQQWKVPRGK